MRSNKFGLVVFLSLLTIIPFQNCNRMMNFESIPKQFGISKNSGNGGVYDGKLVFMQVEPGFKCENKTAPKAILNKLSETEWALTVNQIEKCSAIKNQIVTDVSYKVDVPIVSYQNNTFILDNQAPLNSDLSEYLTEYYVDPTANTNTLDVNPGDGICQDSNGQCSLRAVVDEVNSTRDRAYSIIVPEATYNLTSTIMLNVKNLVAILGDGPTKTLIRGGGAAGLIWAAPGVKSSLSLQNLSLSGASSNLAFSGSAITIYGSMYANNLSVENNYGSASGAAIYAGVGSQNVLIENTSIIQNTTGGISVFGAFAFTLQSSLISDNGGLGFNVSNGTSNVHIVNTRLERNQEGVRFRECHFNCLIEDSIISMNAGNGLSISESDDTYDDTIIRRTRIISNALTSGSNIYLDAAIRTAGHQLRLENSTVVLGAGINANCVYSSRHKNFPVFNFVSTIDDASCN